MYKRQTLLGPHGNARRRECLDVAIDGADADLQLACDLGGDGAAAGLQDEQQAEDCLLYTSRCV